MSSEMRELIEAGNKLLAAMEMQEGRESEALHIAQPTAKHLWDEAKTAWNRALLARTEAGADGYDDGSGRVRDWRESDTHPQDASGDAESTALYLRPYDVTMIGQAKHAGQDMVSVLAHLHPTEGWDVRFNAAMQAKEAK